MKKSCALFKKGKCITKTCKYFHGSEDMKKLSLREEKNNNMIDPLGNFSDYVNIEETIRKRLIDNRKEDTDVNCQDFLKRDCRKVNCHLIHNFSLKNKHQNILEFQECLESFKKDFMLIEPYEAKIVGDSNLDLLFICDCTGSMQPWIEKTKNTIYSIVHYIRGNNKYSAIRIGFVAYRDFCDRNQFEILNFTEKVDVAFKFISGLIAEGGGDIPEDVTGGLIQGLKLNWKSKARYAILITDAPDHGYSDESDDYYQINSIQSNSMDLKEAIKKYAELDVNFYAVEIDYRTKHMFEVMSDCYQEIARKPIHVEKLSECEEKFAFFVAYGASTTLTSVSYSKLDFMQLIKNFKTLSLQSLSLSKDYDKLDASEKSVVDFMRKINANLDEEEENVSGFEVIKKDSFEVFSDTIKSKIIINDLEYPEELEERLPLYDFNDISKIEFDAVCHSFNIVKDFNTEINWKNPVIQQSKISSKVKIDLTPFSKGQMRYAYYMYDTYLNQNLVGKLPIKYKASEYNLEFLSKDIESLIVSDYISKEFNDRIINCVKDTRLLLNFVKAYVYEVDYNSQSLVNNINRIFNSNNENKEEMINYFINDQIIKNNYNLFSVENYIDGSYEKYNNNAGWISGNINESSFITQAFSHFSWQYTKGFLMIVDLQGVGGILTDPQIHCINGKKYGKGNLGYLGMMKFFLTHTCNEYCLALNLINPKKFEGRLDKDFDFFVDKIKIPLKRNKLVNKCCDLCKEPAIFSEYFLYRMKRSGKECFCNTCLKHLKSTIIKKQCKICKNEFIASEYGFKLKRIQIPENCSDCRLAIRNKLRQEKEKILSSDNSVVNENPSIKSISVDTNSYENIVIESDFIEVKSSSLESK